MISGEQFKDMLRKPAVAKANGLKQQQDTSVGESVTEEWKLHSSIIAFCDAQWPQWKYRHARMDVPTTEDRGVEDFTIFAPGGRTIHVECKTKTGKASEHQRNWAHQMALNGHNVAIVRSMEDFRLLISK